MDPVTANLLIFVTTQVINWGVNAWTSWENRDAIRKSMANVDAYMQALWGAAEWTGAKAGMGNIYRGIAEKMVNARLKILELAQYNAQRAGQLVAKLAAFRELLATFTARVSVVLEKVKQEMRNDDVIIAADKRRIELYDTVIAKLISEYMDYFTADPRRIIAAYSDAPDFPYGGAYAGEAQFYNAFYDMYQNVRAYVKRLEDIREQFKSDYLSQAMVPVVMNADKPEEYQNTGGTSYQPRPLSGTFPKFVELSFQGLVTEDVSYTGDPQMFAVLVNESASRIMLVNDVQRVKFIESSLINFVTLVRSRSAFMYLAAAISKAEEYKAGIEEYLSLENLNFMVAVPADIRATVENFFNFERDGLAMANIDAAIEEYKKFPESQSSFWAHIATQQCGDGAVYADGAKQFELDAEQMFVRINQFIESYARTLEERAMKISSDARIGDIYTGASIQRNAVAVSLVNADGTAPGGAPQGLGVAAAIVAGVVLFS